MDNKKVEVAADPAAMWREFTEAIGEVAVRNAYGPHWPRDIIKGELVFIHYYEDQRIGWSSLIYDPSELVVWQSHGIFPAHQRGGFTPVITRHLRATAFATTPCIAVCCKILDTNPRYQEWMRTKNPNKGWEFAGHIALPAPGYDVYSFSRDFWIASEQGRQ